MALGILKKSVLAAALALTVGFTASASACTVETSRPRAKITFSFNDKDYAVEYDLYRNLYPQTVRHFIELANNGFYDNTVIHDYTANDWFGGGYGYDAEAYAAAVNGDSGTVAEYFGDKSKESEYYGLFNDGKLTPSVYSRMSIDDKNNSFVEKQNALPTLMGEFKNNIKQEIVNGQLSAETGSLKMFYFSKKSTSHVYVTPTSDQIIEASYKYNCATSLFSVQVGESTNYGSSDYCVFGKVCNKDSLDAFVKAVGDYFTDTYGTSNTVSASVSVDNLEQFSKEEQDKGIDVTFKLAKKAIIIKKVEITKY